VSLEGVGGDRGHVRDILSDALHRVPLDRTLGAPDIGDGNLEVVEIGRSECGFGRASEPVDRLGGVLDGDHGRPSAQLLRRRTPPSLVAIGRPFIDGESSPCLPRVRCRLADPGNALQGVLRSVGTVEIDVDHDQASDQFGIGEGQISGDLSAEADTNHEGRGVEPVVEDERHSLCHPSRSVARSFEWEPGRVPEAR
jgi:hypothetical protein